VTTELLNKVIKSSVILKRKSEAKSSTEEKIKKIEDDVISIANILTNMVLIGKEKRKKCLFYNNDEGICEYLKLDINVPTLNSIKKQDGYYINVYLHPEVCSTCPHWREGINRKH